MPAPTKMNEAYSATCCSAKGKWRQPEQPHPGTRVDNYRCSLPGLAEFTIYRCGGTARTTIAVRKAPNGVHCPEISQRLQAIHPHYAALEYGRRGVGEYSGRPQTPTPAKVKQKQVLLSEPAMPSTLQSAHQSYHHGDLRNALIIAAVTLIEDSGADQFTMVDAARLAGVSNAAPYRHFKDKEELLQAVAHLGFLGLKEQVARVAQERGLGSIDTIIALGETYVDYVTSRPQFYELMWGSISTEIDAPNDAELKSSGFYVIVDAVSAWGKVEQIALEDPVQIATYLWAMVHGLSSLTLHNHIDRFVPGADVKDMLRSTTETFLSGLRNPGA